MGVELFPCYNFNVRDYLMKKGFRYELVGLNPNTKKPFFVFVVNYRLSKCLEEWKLMTAEK